MYEHATRRWKRATAHRSPYVRARRPRRVHVDAAALQWAIGDPNAGRTLFRLRSMRGFGKTLAPLAAAKCSSERRWRRPEIRAHRRTTGLSECMCVCVKMSRRTRRFSGVFRRRLCVHSKKTKRRANKGVKRSNNFNRLIYESKNFTHEFEV